jgi:hypothetical protein
MLTWRIVTRRAIPSSSISYRSVSITYVTLVDQTSRCDGMSPNCNGLTTRVRLCKKRARLSDYWGFRCPNLVGGPHFNPKCQGLIIGGARRKPLRKSAGSPNPYQDLEILERHRYAKMND